MNRLYPLKFNPIYKEKIWGGEKIKNILKKDVPSMPHCGESWEISAIEGNVSTVLEGKLQGKDLKTIIILYKELLLGKKIYKKYGDEFPLLIKFIDATQDLSLQVHPNDELAKKRHNGSGKSEMWYIMQADMDAKIVTGFNRDMDKEKFLDYFGKGKIMSVLNTESVQEGDVFYLPAGRIHYIGTGCFLIEIQQSSDYTYRIYDFDRTDENGNKRELHLEDALEAMDYKTYPTYRTLYQNIRNEPIHLLKSPYFTVNKIHSDQNIDRDYHYLDSFVIYVCMSGDGNLMWDGGELYFKTGDVILLPACIKKVTLETTWGFSFLETYIQ